MGRLGTWRAGGRAQGKATPFRSRRRAPSLRESCALELKAAAGMADELAEVLPFLDDSRAEVREMAAQGIAGYTATPEGTAALMKCDELYPKLVSLLLRAGESSCGGAAAAAAAATVNLSQQPAERLKLLDVPGAVSAAAACVSVDEPPELAEYASMLLSNLTQLTRGV